MGAHGTGLLLVAAFGVFLTGAAFWRIDEFERPNLEGRLVAVARRMPRWRWIHGWMVAGTVTSAVAVVALARLLTPERGGLATIAAVASALGCGAMLGSLALGLTSTPRAAIEVVRTGALPDGYERWSRRANRLYETHMVLAYGTWVVLGIALLRSPLLSDWVGWVGIALGAAALVGFVTVRGPFAPPILAHFYGLVVGLALLRT
ncbi:MAG: hypothetical protein R3C39_00420 [Dehalococcoidia bacterium]